ncbi:MAG: hypothetical protein HXX09_15205 [Bacteroidetes bacterium]|nr:hypothetical protein [Bacteroidota bacterium]
MSDLKIKAVLYPSTYTNGLRPIYIRITQNRKSTYLSVGYSIPEGAWNETEKEVWENKPSISLKQKDSLTEEELKGLKEKYKKIILLPNATKINNDLKKQIADILKLQNKLEANDQRVNPEILKNKTQKKDTEDIYRNDFLKFIDKVAKLNSNQKDSACWDFSKAAELGLDCYDEIKKYCN